MKSKVNKKRNQKKYTNSFCAPEDLALKSFFLGPQAENSDWLLKHINIAFKDYFSFRKNKFPKDGRAISLKDQTNKTFLSYQNRMGKNFSILLKRLESETPKFTPRYLGHMVSELSTPAILGNIATLMHNPNNVSKDVAKVGLKLEQESISFLAKMIGFNPSRSSGHFTSGGTVANIEALWRARYHLDCKMALAIWLKSKKNDIDFLEICHLSHEDYIQTKQKYNISDQELKKFSFVANSPWTITSLIKKYFHFEFQGAVVLVPGNKHYSWNKAVSLLGLGESAFQKIELDQDGRLCLDDLKKKVEYFKSKNQPILAIISVAGTTELGEIDPIDKVQSYLHELKEKGIFIWHHVDAAYGGYYCSTLDQKKSKKKSSLLTAHFINSLSGIKKCQSVTLDPHKLGYVPYSCGAILIQDKNIDQVSQFSAPYLTPEGKNEVWSSTLEGSRSAVGASATWLSAKSIQLNPTGYGRILEKGIQARIDFVYTLKNQIPNIYFIEPMDTNIFCFCIANKNESLKEVNKRTLYLFDKIYKSKSFSVSKTHLGISDYSLLIQKTVKNWNGIINDDQLTLLRFVMMNPFINSKELKVNLMEKFTQKIKSLITF